MTTKSESVYWDSCVFIDLLQQTPGRIDVLRDLVQLAKEGQLKIVTSAFTIAEVVGLSTERPVPHEDVQKIKAFFENDYIFLRQVDRATVELAADIGRVSKIRPPDAVHLATAIRAKCRMVHTYDGDEPNPGPKKLLHHDGKIGTPALSIKVPFVARTVKQGMLDFSGPGLDDPLNGQLRWIAGSQCSRHPLAAAGSLQRLRHPLMRNQ